MYKQTHIIIFILVSLSLHIAVLSKLQINSTPVFSKSDQSITIELSNRFVQKIAPIKQTDKKSPHKKKIDKPKTIKSSSKSTFSEQKTVKEDKAEENKSLDKPILETENIEKQELLEQEKIMPSQKTNESNTYLQEVLSIIEDNKYYPDSARRRSMEDNVHVSFNLLESGEVEDITISGKYKLLQIAARTAILDSVPFHSPTNAMDFPLKVTYSMAFTLN